MMMPLFFEGNQIKVILLIKRITYLLRLKILPYEKTITSFNSPIVRF